MGGSISRRGVMLGVAASAAALSAKADGARAPKTHEVRIRALEFEPGHFQVQTGDTIRWINEDIAAHTATADAFGWDTGELAEGESAEIVVQRGMEISYFCVYHPHMKGSFEIT